MFGRLMWLQTSCHGPEGIHDISLQLLGEHMTLFSTSVSEEVFE